jgi:hypothetical protein
MPIQHGAIAKWTEDGKRKQKKCASPAAARRHEASVERRRLESKIFSQTRQEERESIQMALTGGMGVALQEDETFRSDGRSVPVGIRGVVSSVGAEATAEEDAAADKEIEKGASRLEKIFARAYEAILQATGKTEGWTEEELKRAHKGAAIQFKSAMPRLKPGADRDVFVACVATGIQLEVFTGKEASQLLYAAQVAATGRKPR